MHTGIPGTYFDSLRTSASQKFVGGVVGGVLAIIAALIPFIGAILKLKGICSQRGMLVHHVVYFVYK